MRVIRKFYFSWRVPCKIFLDKLLHVQDKEMGFDGKQCCYFEQVLLLRLDQDYPHHKQPDEIISEIQIGSHHNLNYICLSCSASTI